MRGSSPRGRGKLGTPTVGVIKIGLIPAWAGKTRAQLRRRPSGRAHPRVGGENSGGSLGICYLLGSSPRGRGKLSRDRIKTTHPGLIPAWAGKTQPHTQGITVFRAHPRVGGENLPDGVPVRGEAGSSPRGRGKPGQDRGRSLVPGLIPAWAGKTQPIQAESHGKGAHPRVGGENTFGARIAATAAGSSPRGRGKHAHPLPRGRIAGLIPAWAGKTPTKQASRSRARAHPRVGGENHRRRLCDRLRSGLIPAWAGKTG